MAKSQYLILISSIFVLTIAFPSTTATYEAKPTPKLYKPLQLAADVVVEGLVYCQSCNYSGTWSLSDAEPIVGAQISVICRNSRDRVSYYKVFKTSGGGYFYAKLEGFAMKHYLLDHPLQSCAVKLVSSPLDTCNEYTGINYGINGAPLRYEKKRLLRGNYEAVVYAAGPLAFRADQCDPEQY